MKDRTTWLRINRAWLSVCVGLGSVGLANAVICEYDEQPPYRVCAWDGDCASWTDPVAKQCVAGSGSRIPGQAVTNNVTINTYINGTCGDFSACHGGTLTSSSPNQQMIDYPCTDCPAG